MVLCATLVRELGARCVPHLPVLVPQLIEALAEQGDRRLEPVRTLFAELDRLEAAVRGRDDAACRRACDIAREIEARLRSIAAEVTP